MSLSSSKKRATIDLTGPLPTALLAVVFGCLSFRDVLLSCRLVCRAWRSTPACWNQLRFVREEKPRVIKRVLDACQRTQVFRLELGYRTTEMLTHCLSQLVHLKQLWALDSGCANPLFLHELGTICKTRQESLELHLNLYYEDEQLEGSSSLPSVRSLLLSGLITKAGLPHLSTMSQLKHLALEHVELTDNGFRRLSVKGCAGFTRQGLRHLSNLVSLQSLNLMYCRRILQEPPLFVEVRFVLLLHAKLDTSIIVAVDQG